MIGIIITGHGHFATGMASSLEVIAGKKENVAFVDFDDDSTDSLANKLTDAMHSLSHLDGILVLADLTGGSPFKTAVECGMKCDKKVEVIGGINLPMVIELTMAREFIADLENLTTMGLKTGKDNITRFEFVAHKEDAEDGDGI